MKLDIRKAATLANSLVEQAILEDDPYIVINEIENLQLARELVGKTLAKLLYSLYINWEKFSISQEESFIDVMKSSLSIHPHTIQRYLNVWRHIKQLPPDISENPIGKIIPITNALSQGYDFSEDDWDEIRNAGTQGEIRKIVRRVKGQEPRKSGIMLYLEQDGSISVWYQGQHYRGGYLNVKSTDEPVIKAVNRITNAAGIEVK